MSTTPTTPGHDPSAARLRGLIMAGIAIIFFAVIGVRLFSLQIWSGETYRAQSQNNFFQFVRLDHNRGEILDAEGRVLVTNRSSVNVAVTPAFFPNARRMVLLLGYAAGLSKNEGLEVSQALSKSVSEGGPPIQLARGLDEAGARRVRRRQLELEIALEAVPIIEMEGKDAGRFSAYLDPQLFPSVGRVVQRLHHILELTEKDAEVLNGRIRRARGLDRYQEIIVRRDVPPRVEDRLALEIDLGELPGVSVKKSRARHYEHATLAAHLIGYVNEISPDELRQKQELGYRIGDTVGRRGIERTFEGELRGTDGRRTVVVDSKGRSQSTRLARELQSSVGLEVPPKPGNRVVLTIDLDLQREAEAAFDGLAGSVVVMDPETGRILALTSTPTYDPNKLVGYFDPHEKKRLEDMKSFRPWRFRAIQDHFAPASTFKVVTALAAFRAGVTRESETVFCPGAYRLGNTRFRCWKDVGHGAMNVVSSIQHSCDVYYYTMGARMGLDPIAETARGLGFGERSGISLAGEATGIIPTKAWYRKHRPPYTLGAAVNASIGQGAVTVTPLQLAVAYAAIANGGTVFEPQVVLRIESYDGKAMREVAPKIRRRLDLSETVLASVREGLRRVVNDPRGTARRVRLDQVEMSGKTGTAQVAKLGKDRRKSRDVPWKLKDHAWFAAYAPADAPEVVVVVLNEHGGGGSRAAAPIAKKVVEAWFEKRQRRAAITIPQDVLVLAGSDVEDLPWVE